LNGSSEWSVVRSQWSGGVEEFSSPEPCTDSGQLSSTSDRKPFRSPSPIKKLIFVAQSLVQAFVGLGAVISGALLIIAPSGTLLRTPLDMLRGSPFDDFLLLGVILVLVNSIRQIVAAILTLRRHQVAGYVGAVFGMGLMVWIFVQVNMIGGGHNLQYSYFLLGVVETSLAFFIQAYLLAEAEVRGGKAMSPND
jgi:hypothetical protein